MFYLFESDKCCIQGGGPYNLGATITLPKPYRDTKYVALANNLTVTDTQATELHATRTTSTLKMTCSYNGNNNYTNGTYIYYTIGYTN